ncbi:MAG TPA: nuclear pore complex subunit [Bacteroidales bacterium]|nr:nuclear pore complex subunit [Bacteroidales bacterium]
MDKVVIQEKSQNCPGMYFTPAENLLTIEGRSIPENPELVYKPVKDWIVDFFNDSESLNIKIVLEYINSGSSKHLLDFLKILRAYHKQGKSLGINWLYEEDDEAILELGEHFRDSSGLPIEIEMLLE